MAKIDLNRLKHYCFDFRAIRFSFKYLLKDLNYSLRTGDQWFEVRYQWHKIWRETTQPVRFVKYFFWRLWRYREILLFDFDWDHGFLLTMLETKFLNMANHHRDHGMAERSGDTALELYECAELCHRIQEDDYTKSEYEAHETKWGESHHTHPPVPGAVDKLGQPTLYRWEVTHDNAGTPELEEQERTERMSIYELGEQRKQADIKRLSELMLKMEYWWD